MAFAPQEDNPMQNTIKAVLVVAALAAGASSAMAAPVRHQQNDPWVQPIHLDNNAVPAKQFFDELQRDGD
jgi:hypothetical protein